MFKIEPKDILKKSPNTAFIFGEDIMFSDSLTIFVANLKTSEIIRLDGSSSFIWELLQEPISLSDILKEIMHIFGKESQEIYDQVNIFLINLLEKGFIYIV